MPLFYVFVEGAEPRHILDRRDDLHNKIQAGPGQLNDNQKNGHPKEWWTVTYCDCAMVSNGLPLFHIVSLSEMECHDQEMSDAIDYLKHELKISKEAKQLRQILNRGCLGYGVYSQFGIWKRAGFAILRFWSPNCGSSCRIQKIEILVDSLRDITRCRLPRVRMQKPYARDLGGSFYCLLAVKPR